MSNALIQIDNESLTALTPVDAIAMRDAALETAALVGRVTNPAEQETAVAAQTALAEFIKLVETSRVAVKERPWKLCQQIDAKAKELSEEAKNERTRITELVGSFQALEQAKVRAAEAAKRLEEERLERDRQVELQKIRDEEAAKQRKLDEEAARVERERKEALRRAQEEEAARKAKLDAEAAAIAAKAREARNKQERAAAEAARVELERKRAVEMAAEAKAQAALRQQEELARLELERQRQLAAADSHARLDAVNEKHCEAVAALPTVTAARAKGQSVKWDWEIVCNDLWALARSHPLCVKLEPRLNEIKALLDAGVKVAGVTAKKVPQSSVRLTPERKAIEV